MKCPKCRFENPDRARFCIGCGEPMEFCCPKCGKATPVAGRFCMECAHPVRGHQGAVPVDCSEPRAYTPKFLAERILTTRSTIEGERKVVTVLFADLANYSFLSEKLDPEEIHQVMDGCFKILMDAIHRYEGTVNQFTGDGVMALFGAPVAHEDHAKGACHAALSIQRALGDYGEKIKMKCGVDFKMRIGLNSGPVVVGSIGDDLRMDYTAVGDTTNLAYRMQDMAYPGKVLVSGNTYRLVRNFFEFDSLGKQPVKGTEEQQEIHELIRATHVGGRIEAAASKGLTKFVGRRKELEALREASEKARFGSGEVAGIVGEAGVGKSRLLLEFKSMLPKGGFTFLEGRCLHYGTSIPFLPVLNVLKAYFEIGEENRETTIKGKVTERLLELDDTLEVVPPALHEVLSLTVEDEKYLQLGPRQRRERIFEAIRDLVIRESQRKSLIIAMEDLHWTDKVSQEFLDYIIGWLPNTHILLILLYRPEYTHNWGSKSYYTQISLEQLSTRRSAQLVQAILKGGEIEPELRELILSKAGGNPLFVEELTNSLLENGSIQRKNNQYLLSKKVSDIEVPDTIQGIIADRLDRLEGDLKRILQAASVIGREFAYPILATITGMNEALKASLLVLQNLELIYEKQLFPELVYMFKHALTQDVAYNSLLLKWRMEIHEKIGKAIEETYSERLEESYELLAYHYLRSSNKQKAVEYLDLANLKTANAGAMEEAKAYFNEAMELLDTLPDTDENCEHRASLLVNQSIVFELLFQWTEYYDLLVLYESSAARVRNPGLLGAFYNRMAGCEWSFGLFDKAIHTSTKAADLCEAAGNKEDMVYLCVLLECSHLWKGNFYQALAFKEKALHMMGERFSIYLYGRAMCMGSLTFTLLGRWDQALELAGKAKAEAEKYADKSQICIAATTISVAYCFKGDLARAIEHGELAVQQASTPMDKAWAQACLARAWCKSGEPNKGIEVLAPFVELAQAARYVSGVLPGMVWLSQAYCLAGEYDKGRQMAEGLKDVAERCGARHYLGLSHYLLGEIALESGSSRAANHFCNSIAIFQETQAENDLALAFAAYGRLRKQQGHVAEARLLFTKALGIFERLGTLVEPEKVRQERDALLG